MDTRTHIFSDDLAKDIEVAFNHAISNGSSVPEASRYVLDIFGQAAERFEKTNILCLRLAALQVEHGHVEKDIKNKALAIIDGGQVQCPKRRHEDKVYFGQEEFLSGLKEDLQRSAGGR